MRPSACRRSASSLDEGDPVRPRRRPRVAAVGEGELLVVEVDAGEVAVGGEVGDRVDVRGPAGRRRRGSPPSRPAPVPSRIDATSGTPRSRACVDELLGLRRPACSARPRSTRRRSPRTRTATAGGAGRPAPPARAAHPRAPSTAPTRGRRRAAGAGRCVVAPSRPSARRSADDDERDDRRPEPATPAPTASDDVASAPASDAGRLARSAAASRRGVRQTRRGRRARRPSGVGTMVAQVAGMSHEFGTASTTQPAAPADATPGRRVLDGDALAGSTPRRCGRQQVRLWVRLAVPTASPVMTAWNEPGASASTIASTSRRPRHRHQRARHAGRVQLAPAAGGRRGATGRARARGR